MRKLLVALLLICPLAFAQFGGHSGLGGHAGFGGSNAGSGGGAVATYDASSEFVTGANSTYSISVTVGTGHSNMALLLLSSVQDTGTVAISSISCSVGTCGTWANCGTGSLTGNGNMRGQVWGATVSSTGTVTASVTLTGTVTTGAGAILYSIYNVKQSGVCGSPVVTTSGSENISISANDIALSADFDGNTNRTVSGCTTTLDQSGFSTSGFAAAHCSANPTSTFTWSGFATNSIAEGVDVPHS